MIAVATGHGRRITDVAMRCHVPLDEPGAGGGPRRSRRRTGTAQVEGVDPRAGDREQRGQHDEGGQRGEGDDGGAGVGERAQEVQREDQQRDDRRTRPSPR